MSTSTFASFPLLPTELRLKIWDLALPGPRLLFLPSSSSSTKITTNNLTTSNFNTIQTQNRTLQALNATCRSSRQTLKEQYIHLPSFSLFYNAKLDTLFINPKTDLSRLVNPEPALYKDLGIITKLAAPFSLLGSGGEEGEGEVYDVISSFRNLKEVGLVVWGLGEDGKVDGEVVGRFKGGYRLRGAEILWRWWDGGLLERLEIGVLRGEEVEGLLPEGFGERAGDGGRKGGGVKEVVE